MTTEAHQSDTDAPSDEESSGKGLRAQLEKALAQNKRNEAFIRDRAFKDAGLDTSTGLGKAIAQVYEGDPTADAILTFATEEYGYTPTADGPQPHPQAAQIAVGQHQLDQMGNVAGSVTQTNRIQRLAQAKATGDHETEGAIMAAQMQAMMDAQAPKLN